MTIPDEFVSRMHAEYSAGASLCEVARRHGKNRTSLREIFTRRGLPVRQTCVFRRRLSNGRIAPAPALTPEQIDALVAAATRIRVPGALKREWRAWSLAKRWKFIVRLRAKLHSPNDRPATPFSKNVQPFDYSSKRAWAICERLNAGRNSRTAAIKINICSQGVIYRDRLWFWTPKTGYQLGPWTPGLGRPALHRVIWEEASARPVPAGHCVTFLDGNPNNLAPENLALLSRNENARRNQAAALAKKSRAATAMLLRASQQHGGGKVRAVISQIATRKKSITKKTP